MGLLYLPHVLFNGNVFAEHVLLNSGLLLQGQFQQFAGYKKDLENKTSFQSLLLLHTSDFLSVPAMAINFLSYLKKAFGDCILLPIWNKLHLKVI